MKEKGDWGLLNKSDLISSQRMARWKKTVAKILRETKFENLDFADFEGAIKGVGYCYNRTAGSHDIYVQDGWRNMDIQPENGKAKPYQVRQFKKELINHDY